MLRKILAAIDTEESCEFLFEETLSLSQTTGAKLILVGVLSPHGDSSLPVMGYPGAVGYPLAVPDSTWEVFQQQYQAYKKRGLDGLSQLRDRAIAAGVDARIIQETGDPGQVICDCARTGHSDLIVVGSHGRRGIDEFLMGSVSSYVMHRAPCSVLIARENSQGQEIADMTKSEEIVKTE